MILNNHCLHLEILRNLVYEYRHLISFLTLLKYYKGPGSF